MPNAVNMNFTFDPSNANGDFASVNWNVNGGTSQPLPCKCGPGDSFSIVIQPSDGSKNTLSSGFAIISARKNKGGGKSQASPFLSAAGQLQTGFPLSQSQNASVFSTTLGNVPAKGATGSYEVTVSAAITLGGSGLTYSYSDDPEMDVGDVGADYGTASA